MVDVQPQQRARERTRERERGELYEFLEVYTIMLGADVTTALHKPSSFSSTSVAGSRSESSFIAFTVNKPSLPPPPPLRGESPTGT